MMFSGKERASLLVAHLEPKGEISFSNLPRSTNCVALALTVDGYPDPSFRGWSHEPNRRLKSWRHGASFSWYYIVILYYISVSSLLWWDIIILSSVAYCDCVVVHVTRPHHHHANQSTSSWWRLVSARQPGYCVVLPVQTGTSRDIFLTSGRQKTGR